jgi:predicted amidohydrolase
MRIGGLQLVARVGDIRANLAMIGEAAAEAKAADAEILVAPELAVTGYGAGEAIRALAEPVTGGQVAVLGAMAAEHGITVLAGFAERSGEAIFNSAILIEPDGRHIVYRKCHLYGEYERALFTPGDAPPDVSEMAGTRVGILICYDVEFPEMTRKLALAGAELVLVPTAQPENESAAFICEKMVPVRAFENQIAIVYADHAGRDAHFAYAGRSSIVMPDGSDAARAGKAGRALLVADYVPGRYASSRATNPYLADRRVDLL